MNERGQVQSKVLVFVHFGSAFGGEERKRLKVQGREAMAVNPEEAEVTWG